MGLFIHPASPIGLENNPELKEAMQKAKEGLHKLMEKRAEGTLTDFEIFEFMRDNRDGLMAVSKAASFVDSIYNNPQSLANVSCSCGSRDDSCGECVSWDGSLFNTSGFGLSESGDVVRFQIQKDRIATERQLEQQPQGVNQKNENVQQHGRVRR